MQGRANPRTAEQTAALTELDAERNRIAQRLSSLDRAYSELVEENGAARPDDEHDPDGTTAYDRAQVIALRDATRQRLRQVEAALVNIDAEDFGVCTRCHGPIGRERLEALPGVERCVTCAGALG